MNIKTVIVSLGSKWAGEKQNTIDELIEVLQKYTIEERFFHSYGLDIHGQLVQDKQCVVSWENVCPIEENYKEKVFPFFKNTIEDGTYRFLGNFEEYSFVFHVITNDKDIIDKLVPAIKSNKGWELYYEKNKVNHGSNS